MNAYDGFRWFDAIGECPKAQWSRLADQYDTPLLDWNWLRILEESGSVGPEEGWIPQHLGLYENGELIAAAPLYVKTHSAGEFVFDYAWADVAEQIGSDYYPKLVAMSPLTPAIGYRFLIDRSRDPGPIVGSMLSVIHEFCRANSLHGFSVLWPEPDFAALLPDSEFTPWRHQHFRWENEQFRSFDDYLAVFNKNQRRNIRREVASIGAQGLEIRSMLASEAPASFFPLMYRFYKHTNDQFGMWAARFLTPEFFPMVRDACGGRVLFCGAFEPGERDPVGMSMLLYKPDRLIGRYWGSSRFVENLHFVLCYYEPIRWAIEHGVTTFDPGMGSSHKVRRGFRAVPTTSLHHFYDERMQLVMKLNIDKINRYEQLHIDSLNEHLPFAERR